MTHENESVSSGQLTAGSDYAERLQTLETKRWKALLDVQRPYRWNLRRLDLGHTLDVGCGLGRNLRNLGPNSVGVDHNKESIRIARASGLVAYDTDEFWSAEVSEPGRYDSLLIAHVLEHVSRDVATDIIAEYLPCVRRGGKVVFITPQERGFRSDPTHIRWVDFPVLTEHAKDFNLSIDRTRSFPLPRAAGRAFTYNEFNLIATIR